VTDEATAPTTPDGPSSPPSSRARWLPAPGTWRYHLLLGAIGIFVLGPLGGVAAAFMNFSIGFFVGGQVLAGILGSIVTYGYGPDGKHGANFMQTCAASVAGLSGMSVLVQAMIWLGLPEPPAWQLVVYLLCIGMFGVGIGMLYTPILVDRLKLPYPSGLAVANILRALTDKRLLKRSLATLGGGTAVGLGGGVAALIVPFLGDTVGVSMSTLGAGMIVGARIGIPAIAGGLTARALRPYFVSIHWLEPSAPFRKITFVIALGMIMGASAVDIVMILFKAAARLREVRAVELTESRPTDEPWKTTNTTRLVLWSAVWGAGVVAMGSLVLHASTWFLVFGVVLVLLFVMVNGISQGISDSNPISSAFVVTVLLMGTLGLKDPGVALFAAAIIFVSVSVACDMQQDRSTGWRLGTNRTIQFRYQVAGVAVGAVMAVAFAKVFMSAYPVLRVDQTTHDQVKGWTSAMTFKMVGAISNLTNPKPYTYPALWIGFGIGLATEVLRKIVKGSRRYAGFAKKGRIGAVVDFVLDAVILPSPYASSFGGFVPLGTSLWFGAGGVLGSMTSALGKTAKRFEREGDLSGEALPEDMSAVSLFGGGLIAGDSLAALGFGISVLLSKLLGR
jgi:uncharacterized oligopeptide transporter (OPT) family protein